MTIATATAVFRLKEREEGISMQYEQIGIPGVAENKVFEPKTRNGVEKIVRKKLMSYIREKLRVDQNKFADMLKVCPASVSQWLYSDRMPSARVLFKMSSEFGLSSEEVLELFKVS